MQRYVASLPPSEASSSTVMHVAAVVAAACSWILGSDWWTRCCLYSWAATTAHGPCRPLYVIEGSFDDCSNRIWEYAILPNW